MRTYLCSGNEEYMFDNGLEYLRVDFHLHTRKDKEFKYTGEEDRFISDYVTALKDNNIKIGVITNHNKFELDEYKAIRKAGRREEIFILPGIELSVKEGANGIHTLIVFNPDDWLSNGENHIQNFLANAFAGISNPEHGNVKCKFDLDKTIDTLEGYKKDYFIVFAHVDQDSGLFKECKGGILDSFKRIPKYKDRVIGLQKSRTAQNLKRFNEYFEYLPACVEGSDPKSIKEIGKGDRSTYLKIGEYSYQAVKFTLQDYGNRVRNIVPDKKHGFIESITFEGGKFDGQKINFSSELNTLIGIRGSGKSSVLEVIRYLLNISAEADESYKELLIKNVFGSGGKVVMSVVDKHGKRYEVVRIFGERTSVINEEGMDLNVTPTSLIEGIQYFGQKDLSSSADKENILLDKLVNISNEKKADLISPLKDIKSAIDQALDLSKIPGQIEELTVKKAELKNKMLIYKEKGVAEKLDKQSGYERDKVKLEATQDKITKIYSTLHKASGNTLNVEDIFSGHESKYNKSVLDKSKKVLVNINKQIEQIQQITLEIKKNQDLHNDIVGTLSKNISELKDEFAEIKREIKDDTLDVDSFINMTSELEKTNGSIKELSKLILNETKIKDRFKKATRQRNDKLREEYNYYKKEVDRINTTQSELEINIKFKGDKENFKLQMKSDFKGSGIYERKYLQLSEKFVDYIDMIDDWILEDGKELKEILSASEYSKLDDKLRTQYEELIEYQVKNSVEILYHGKNLKQHSLGQRASALILFILTQDNNDIIIIDQPEDDLDNKVIYDEVISAIAKKKQGIQFIFATHNANIPVLGDAERIIAVEFQDSKIAVLQGSIDLQESQKQIVDIMEGGKEAFNKRQLIYTSWV